MVATTFVITFFVKEFAHLHSRRIFFLTRLVPCQIMIVFQRRQIFDNFLVLLYVVFVLFLLEGRLSLWEYAAGRMLLSKRSGGGSSWGSIWTRSSVFVLSSGGGRAGWNSSTRGTVGRAGGQGRMV